MVGDERVGIGRVEQGRGRDGTGGSRGEGIRVERSG